MVVSLSISCYAYKARGHKLRFPAREKEQFVIVTDIAYFQQVNKL